MPVKPRYRGFHRFDLTTCIGCDKCARACPVDCIYIEKIKNPVGKGFRVNGFKIDYTKCMFCALCVDPCPVDCIFMGSTYDQSCFSRDGCIVDFAKLPVEVAWGQATLNPTAVAASKLQTEPVWTKPPDPPPPPKPAAAAASRNERIQPTVATGGLRKGRGHEQQQAATRQEILHRGRGQRHLAAGARHRQATSPSWPTTCANGTSGSTRLGAGDRGVLGDAHQEELQHAPGRVRARPGADAGIREELQRPRHRAEGLLHRPDRLSRPGWTATRSTCAGGSASRRWPTGTNWTPASPAGRS